MDYLDKILDDSHHIMGEVYMISNNISQKVYIGQTLTHRKNKGKYRPFGYTKRFKCHLDEARTNTKKKVCAYIFNAIRKYGREAFSVKLLERVPRQDLDDRERYYIKAFNSIFPNGYNLTEGGKSAKCVKVNVLRDNNANVNPQWRTMPKSEETRERISWQLKQVSNMPEVQAKRSQHAKDQHLIKKISKFQGVNIDVAEIENYIKPIKNGFKVTIQGLYTKFLSKHLSMDELRKEALSFIQQLAYSNNHMGLGNPQAST